MCVCEGVGAVMKKHTAAFLSYPYNFLTVVFQWTQTELSLMILPVQLRNTFLLKSSQYEFLSLHLYVLLKFSLRPVLSA